jgi:hypothetical protein
MQIEIYTWRCHNETPCITILNKLNCLFSKMKDTWVEWVLSGRLVPVQGGGCREGVKEGETILRMRERG